jgi:long-subunit fatty acid transport protein
MRAIGAFGLTWLIVAAPAAAQVLSSPPNGIILPNYDLVRLGQWEAVEAGAVVARTDGPMANVYNPAGLAAAQKTEINGSATGYQYTSVSLDGLGAKASSSRFFSLSGFLGVVFADPVVKSTKWRLGFSVYAPINWEPGTLSGAGQLPGAGTNLSLEYRTKVRLNATVGSLAAGVRLSPKVRAGVGLQVPVVAVLQQQSTSLLSTSATEASTVDRIFAADGSTWLVRATAGVQWDVAPAISLGLSTQTPTARLFGTSFYSDQLTASSGLGFASLRFRDPDARLVYKLPFMLAGGAAFRIGKIQLEADVRWYASVSPFDLYSSKLLGVAVRDSGAAPPVIGTATLVPVTMSFRSITNFSVGARYPLSRQWELHAGFNSDQSPLSGTNEIFRNVNIIGGTAGVSFTGAHLSGSLGLGFQTGRSPPTPVGSGSDLAETRLKVTALQLLYSIAYAF